MAHRTIARSGRAEEVIKNSRFLGFASPITEAAAGEDLLARLRQEHSGAAHHCWAYRVGNEMRYSDDGEPGGTAGRPILEVVLKRELDRVAVVVVRYFGGTKLGAGGLARAYGGTAAKTLDDAGEREVEDRLHLDVHVPFPFVDPVHRLLDETRGARMGAEGFDAQGWRFDLDLPEVEGREFRRRLADLTRGASSCQER